MTIKLKGEWEGWILTTDHAASSYGIPVLLANGEALGAADLIHGIPAGDMIAGWSYGRTGAERELAEKFCASNPSGLQPV